MSSLALLPGVQAKTRHQQKSMLVLRFLRTVTYSTTDILGAVLDISKRQHVNSFLQQMEEASLVTHREFAELGGRITLWGITATGQDRAVTNGEDVNQSVFNPSKISVTNLLHYLDLEWIHVRAAKAGWRNFIYVDRYRRKHIEENKHRASGIRPDLLATNPSGHRAAVEYERIRKSAQRYKDEVIPGHVRNLNAGEYEFVLWVTPTPDDQQELFPVISNAVEQIRAEGRWNLQVPTVTFTRFQFANLKAWPNY